MVDMSAGIYLTIANLMQMSDMYQPTLGARFIGGLQGGVTAALILGTLFSLYSMLVFSNTENWIPYATEIYSAIIVGAFVIGWKWVANYTKNEKQENNEKRQRIDYLLLIIGWPVIFLLLYKIQSYMNIDLIYKGISILDALFGLGSVLFATSVVYYLKSGPIQLLRCHDGSLGPF